MLQYCHQCATFFVVQFYNKKNEIKVRKKKEKEINNNNDNNKILK